MIPMNFNEERALVEENRQKLLRSARLHQLYLQVEEDRPQFGERLMALLGDLMISGGQKLKARSAIQYTVKPQNS